MRSLLVIFFLQLTFFTAFAQSSNWHRSTRCSGNYTYEAIENRIEGITVIRLLVTPHGKVIKDSTRVVKRLGYGLDEIAMKTVNNLPPFPPGKTVSNKPQFYNLPVKFTLASITPCEKSDYHLFRGLQLTKTDSLAGAYDQFVKALDFDKKNYPALKHLTIVRFKLGKEIEVAEKNWKTLYKKKVISEEEFKRKY